MNTALQDKLSQADGAHVLKSGLCSVSFPRLNALDVVELTAEAGLEGIEWAGNAHVLPGKLKLASNVRKMTEEAGLEISSYGSYWKVVDTAGKPQDFTPVLESALALGTKTIRIWGGHKPSDVVTRQERAAIIDEIFQALEKCSTYGIRLALEFHANTISDSNTATADLLDEIQHPNLFTYWQPIYWLSDPAYCLDGLNHFSNRVLNLHVFHWLFNPGAGSWSESTNRRPLSEGSKDWATYLNVSLNPDHDHWALMEFVRNDEPRQFFEDASILKQWLARKSSKPNIVLGAL